MISRRVAIIHAIEMNEVHSVAEDQKQTSY